jgi:hypothetical protein
LVLLKDTLTSAIKCLSADQVGSPRMNPEMALIPRPETELGEFYVTPSVQEFHY